MRRQGGATTVTTGTEDPVAEDPVAEDLTPEKPAAEDPTTDELPAKETATGEPATDETPPGTGHRRLRFVVWTLVVALLVAGGGLFVMGRQLRDTPATSNAALTDSEATTRVAGDITNALGKVFSYSPSATAVTKESAKQLLAGKALQQYAALFGQVEKQAADQKLTLTTHVVRAGVTRLTDDSAHLLVFLDQVYERRGKTASTAAAQLSVTAELRDGRWTIVEITSR
uniref:Mce-associated membrane protein n=1 Tax=Streptomyces sp. NBC_00008 TaxID=2903610 RepID=A0AAU2VIT4_9ACTN